MSITLSFCKYSISACKQNFLPKRKTSCRVKNIIWKYYKPICSTIPQSFLHRSGWKPAVHPVLVSALSQVFLHSEYRCKMQPQESACRHSNQYVSSTETLHGKSHMKVAVLRNQTCKNSCWVSSLFLLISHLLFILCPIPSFPFLHPDPKIFLICHSWRIALIATCWQTGCAISASISGPTQSPTLLSPHAP